MSATKIIYDASVLATMKTFENMTRAAIKDCIVEEERIIFVVLEGELKKALGKGAENIKKLGEKFKKKAKVVEFSTNMLTLIKNFIHPLKVENMTEQDNVVVLESTDTKVKGLLIGRAAKNLRALENNIRRYYPDLKEIKVQ
jgi:transcription termination/antitermination protein NusA